MRSWPTSVSYQRRLITSIIRDGMRWKTGLSLELITRRWYKAAPWPLMPPRPTVALMPWSSASPPIRADGTCSGRSRRGAASSSSSSPNVADEQCRRVGNLTNRCSLKDRQRLPLSLRIPRPCPVSIRRRNRAPARGPPWRRSTPMKNQACEHLAETRSSRSKTICVDKPLHDARHEICISN
jgi:hypothetical protein